MNTGEGIPHTMTYDARDNGDGSVVNTMRGFAVNISNGEPRLSDVMGTLQARATSGGIGSGAQMNAVLAFAQNTRDEVRVVPGDKICALAAQPGMKQTNYVLTYDARGNGEGVGDNTLSGDHQNRVTDYTAIVLRNREGKPGGGKGPLLSAERQRTLGTANDQVVFTHQQFGGYSEGNDVAPTMQARDYKDATTLAIGQVGTPRRLTPVECERLMGWPDQHTAHGISEAGKPYALADTARYKLCGNGIASPVTAWIGFQLRHYLTSGKPSPSL
jgi:site-specific DNA-cytosine methylase